MGVENPAATEIRSPDRPVLNQSLYRLRYPTPLVKEPKITKFAVLAVGILRLFLVVDFLIWCELSDQAQPY